MEVKTCGRCSSFCSPCPSAESNVDGGVFCAPGSSTTTGRSADEGSFSTSSIFSGGADTDEGVSDIVPPSEAR